MTLSLAARCTRSRDLARFGLLRQTVASGRAKQLVSEEWIDLLSHPGALERRSRQRLWRALGGFVPDNRKGDVPADAYAVVPGIEGSTSSSRLVTILWWFRRGLDFGRQGDLIDGNCSRGHHRGASGVTALALGLSAAPRLPQHAIGARFDHQCREG